ncbi:MAG: C39 family peptidase [Promethearchaeota archaeon]
MKLVRNRIALIAVIAIFLSIGIPRVSTLDTVGFVITDQRLSADSGEVTGVPYVWQELNGFCHWATVSMALQKIGFQLDLAEVFAATGVGFSAAYVRYEDIWKYMPGPIYRQQSAMDKVADFLGFEIEFYMDTDSTEFGSLMAIKMESENVNWTEIDGWDEAIQILKNGIDSGVPVEIYVNIQNLPASDYDLFRNLGINDTDPTHSILVTGFNETSSTVHIMDPAIGLFDDPASFPDDGSWFYEINFTSLKRAWLGLYGTTVIKPGSGTAGNFTSNLANYILDRLRGDRSSYALGGEDVFFWNFGSNAFRAMAADLTDTGLSSFMDEFDEYNLQTRSIILQNIGFEIETYLTLQYESYQAAIYALPSLLPDLNLQEFVSESESALEHFDVFSDNSTVNTPFYDAGKKMATKTFGNIAYQYEYVSDGDLSSAVSVCEEDLTDIQTHLIAIADAWDAAADALERALQGQVTPPIILLSTSIAGILVLVLVLVRRR